MYSWRRLLQILTGEGIKRRDMLQMMLNAVYIDMPTKQIVGLEPKADQASPDIPLSPGCDIYHRLWSSSPRPVLKHGLFEPVRFHLPKPLSSIVHVGECPIQNFQTLIRLSGNQVGLSQPPQVLRLGN